MIPPSVLSSPLTDHPNPVSQPPPSPDIMLKIPDYHACYSWMVKKMPLVVVIIIIIVVVVIIIITTITQIGNQVVLQIDSFYLNCYS